MNQVVLMGRLTRDPELRHTQTGTPVASFTIAVDRGFTPKDGGERQVDFIDVVAWRGTAELVTKHFCKGMLISVVGRLQIRDWTDKDNNKRRNAEVVSENVYFTDSRRKQDGDASVPQGGYSGGYSTPVESGGFTEIADDDGDLPW